jgi:hypothetical protein
MDTKSGGLSQPGSLDPNQIHPILARQSWALQSCLPRQKKPHLIPMRLGLLYMKTHKASRVYVAFVPPPFSDSESELIRQLQLMQIVIISRKYPPHKGKLRSRAPECLSRRVPLGPNHRMAHASVTALSFAKASLISSGAGGAPAG